MGLEDTLKEEVAPIFRNAWTEREGEKVPEPEDIKLGNDAVHLDATVLYADLAESTALVDGYKWWFAGEIYKAFLHCAARIIRANGGSIVSYDGDRIMAVFIGSSKNTSAVRTALCINGAVHEVLNPAIAARYTTTPYTIKHAVGVDTGSIYAARTGIRGHNDLVWIGKPANHAAKLCDLRYDGYASWITSEVYDDTADSELFSERHGNASMWSAQTWTAQHRQVYGSIWYRYGY